MCIRDSPYPACILQKSRKAEGRCAFLFPALISPRLWETRVLRYMQRPWAQDGACLLYTSIYFVQKNCKTRKVAQILFRFLLFLHKGPGVSFIPPAALQKRKPPPAYYAGSGVYCTSKYVGHSHFFRTMTTTATACLLYTSRCV